MSGPSNRRALRWMAVKSLVFAVATLLATTMLALTIRNSDSGDAYTYTAVFTDATSVNRGDDVRIAGVKVGTVENVTITDRRLAEVTFTVAKDLRLSQGTVVQIRFRNLVGQRYLSLNQPSLTDTDNDTDTDTDTDTDAASGSNASTVATTTSDSSSGGTLAAGHTFGVDETEPALDLTLLFNGFRPLLRMLDADQVNDLSAQIIAVFQGEGATVEGLLNSTASLTSALAEKDQVIGQLIESLSSVLTTIGDRSSQLDTTLVTMQQLVSGLAEDRESIGNAITGIGKLTTSVSGLVEDTRPALRKSITHLGDLATTLDENSDEVDSFLKMLPTKLDQIGRLGSYGSWLNFYLCSVEGRIPLPEGYLGDLGVQPIDGRCR